MSNAAVQRDCGGIGADSIGKGYEIKRIPGQPDGYELVMSGYQSPGWVGRLAAGLSQHRVGIVRGEAQKVSASSWFSRFELKSAPFARNPFTLDYPALAATESPHQITATQIALLHFSTRQETQTDGTLQVEVTGVDRLGFLGDLLDYFSMRCLFPVKMTIETEAEKAVDRFFLRGVGGSRPSESITAALRENLERLLVHKT